MKSQGRHLTNLYGVSTESPVKIEVMKCGWLSPDKAMNVICSTRVRAMARLDTSLRKYPNNTTFSSLEGG